MTQDRDAHDAQQIRDALQQLDAATPPHNLPTSAEAWSRLQFRLAHHARTNRSVPDASTLLAALYVLVFLLWTTSPGWLSTGLLAIIAAAAVASLFLVLRASRSLSN